MYTPPCASPAVEQRSYPSSRDSGCYASWEHIHNRNHQSKTLPLLSNNKENVLPENFHVSTNESSNKVESNYSEEDREVFELIKRSIADDCNHGDSSHQGIDIVTCSYAETQTSPSGSSSGANPSTHIHASKIPQQSVIDSKTSKTFVRKNVPRMGSVVRDATVQVMSPISSAHIHMPVNSSNNDQKFLPSDAHCRVSSDSASLCMSTQSDGHRKILSENNNPQTPSHHVPCYDSPKPRTMNGSVSASPVAGYRQVKKSLVNIVASKLASEAIDLSQEPYSTQVCIVHS